MPIDHMGVVYPEIHPSELSQIPYINKNFWVTIENESFAHWKTTFSRNIRLSIKQLIDFILRIHNLGAYYNTCDIIGHGKLKNLDYSTVIQKQLENVSQLTVFDLSVPQSDEDDFWYAMGAINYFETFIRDRQMKDVGQLLRQLKPDKVQQFATTYMVSAAPVSLKGFEVHKLEDGNLLINTNETIEINLNTDIWFPWVVGFMEDKPAQSQEDMYDNRQLALRHTPRFNDFLYSLRTLTDSLDMAWELKHVHPSYNWMVNENGINLDIELSD